VKRQRENGFTLIEIVISMAILGILIPAMTMSVIMILRTFQKVDNQNIVLQQVQNSSYWIMRDVQTAEIVTPTETNGFPLILNIPVNDDQNDDLTIEYVFEDETLKRKAYDSSHTLISEKSIADYLVVADTTFSSIEPNVYNLVVAASRRNITLERAYNVSTRLSNS
jgi:prepilin-type N-terminal cleavage/methylation domain-containing protein